MRTFERSCFAIAFFAAVLAWLIPNHYPPWTSFYNESAMAFAIVALFGVAVTRRERIEVPLSVWVLLVVAAVPGTQWLFGLLNFSGDAVVASVYVIGASASLFIGYALTRSGRSQTLATLLSSAALLAASVSSLIAITQAFHLVSWGIWAEFATSEMRAVGNLGQPNNLATLLGLGALGAFHLYERGSMHSALAAALVVLLEFAGALTQSRISLFFGVFLLVAIHFSTRRGARLKTPVKAAAALTLLHWFLMLSLPYLLTALFAESPELLADRGVDTSRYQMWKMLIDATNEAPWTGYGWLQVAAAELVVVDRYPPIKELWAHGHNVLLELVVWCGWPLGAMLGGALVFWFTRRVHQARTLEAIFGMLVFAFVGLHSLVELPYHYAYFLFPVALWAGIVESEVGAATVASGRWMIVPAAAALAVFFGFWSMYPSLEEDFRQVRYENARISIRGDERVTVDAPLMSSLTAFLRFSRSQPTAEMSQMQIEEMRRVVWRYPYAPSLVRYSTALAMNGQLDLARATFVKVRYVFGARTYQRFRVALHDEVGHGQVTLAPLDRALPTFLPLSD